MQRVFIKVSLSYRHCHFDQLFRRGRCVNMLIFLLLKSLTGGQMQLSSSTPRVHATEETRIWLRCACARTRKHPLPPCQRRAVPHGRFNILKSTFCVVISAQIILHWAGWVKPRPSEKLQPGRAWILSQSSKKKETNKTNKHKHHGNNTTGRFGLATLFTEVSKATQCHVDSRPHTSYPLIDWLQRSFVVMEMTTYWPYLLNEQRWWWGGNHTGRVFVCS